MELICQLQAIYYFLDKLYMSRISIQMLISRHNFLYYPEDSNSIRSGLKGKVDAPNIELQDLTDSDKSSVDFVYSKATFTSYYSMEFHEDCEVIPDINLRILKSSQDISIKIFNLVGGISRNVAEN